MVATLLSALPASLASQESTTRSRLWPAAVAIYYGYPSLVNGASGDIDRAAATFADYDVIVLGDGLQFPDVDPRRRPPGPGADEHRRTRAIIARLRAQSPSSEVYGYIDLGSSQKLAIGEIERRARLWSAMGVNGVFLDEAGFDFGVTRERQNAVIDLIHSLGLNALVNAFDPDDVFSAAPVALNSAGGGNPTGLPSRLGPQDGYLLESFQVRLGQLESWSAWAARTEKAVAFRDRYRTRVFAITTTTTESARDSTRLFRYAWWSAALWALDGVGWGEPDFSAGNSELPARHRLLDREALAGTRFVSPVAATATGFERRTDAGTLVLDRREQSGRFLRKP